MKNILIPIAGILILMALIVGAGKLSRSPHAPEKETLDRRALPSFEQYAIADVYTGNVAPVNFASEPSARTFRTVISEEAKRGVNFAGHYILTSWGCGTSCQTHALIDAKTGAIVEYPFESSYGVSFKPWSRLLIVNPEEEIATIEESSYIHPTYYVLDQANDLIFLAKRLMRSGEFMCTRAILVEAAHPATGSRMQSEPCDVKPDFVVVAFTHNPAVNFTDRGVIVTREDGEKYFVYEKPGAPALSVKLSFNDHSRCYDGPNGERSCDPRVLPNGIRAYIEGLRTEDTVTIALLELLP